MSERISSIESSDNHELEFGEKFKLVYGEYSVEYFDSNPEADAEQRPIILLGGWAATLESLSIFAETVYYSGRRVIALDYTSSPRANRQYQESYEIDPEVLRKAEGLQEVLVHAEIKKADIIAISGGALTAVSAARLYPDYDFRNLILITPAGLIGKDSAWGFGGLAWRYFVRNTLENRRREAQYDNPKADLNMDHVAADWRKYYLEGRSIAKTRLDGWLSDWQIRTQSMGRDVNIGILSMNKDVIFPSRRVGKQIGLEKSAVNVDAWAMLNDREASHHYPVMHSKKIAEAALDMLNSL